MEAARWVFLRGLARRKEHWGGFIERFSQALPGDEVEAIDLCGNGTEKDRPVPGSIPEITDDLRARSLLLRKGPVRVVAISLGGMVAADWVSRHPGEVVSALLINTSDRSRSPFWERLRPQNYTALLRLLVSRPDALERERTVMGLVSNLPPETRELHARAFSRVEAPTRTSFVSQVRAAARFAPAPQAPTVPVTILNSLGDRLVHPACSERLARAWGAELKTHPWAGHDLPLDDPEWVLEKILESARRKAQSVTE